MLVTSKWRYCFFFFSSLKRSIRFTLYTSPQSLQQHDHQHLNTTCLSRRLSSSVIFGHPWGYLIRAWSRGQSQQPHIIHNTIFEVRNFYSNISGNGYTHSANMYNVWGVGCYRRYHIPKEKSLDHIDSSGGQKDGLCTSKDA